MSIGSAQDGKATKNHRTPDPVEPQPEEQPNSAKQPQKKKKRGRPRKEIKTTEEQETNTSERNTIAIATSEQLQGNLHDSDYPGAVSEQLAPDENRVSSVDATIMNANTDPDTAEPQPPPEKKIKQTTEAPSSVGKGKTSYRVGLSKRARIAPLLRIVKK